MTPRMMQAKDVNESAWHVSDFNSISNNGNNWWCGNEEDNGYLDNCVYYVSDYSSKFDGGCFCASDCSVGFDSRMDDFASLSKIASFVDLIGDIFSYYDFNYCSGSAIDTELNLSKTEFTSSW